MVFLLLKTSYKVIMAKSVRVSTNDACCFRPMDDGSMRLIFEVTRMCNLNCIHCMAPYEDNYRGLSYPRVIRLMHELKKNKISKIMFTGGEPLLNSHIYEYIRIAVQYGVVVDLNSNLTLLSQDKAKILIESGINEVTTSLDGDKDIHCSIRGDSECYDKTLNAISILCKNNVKVDIVCMVLNNNWRSLKTVVNIAEQIGASSITFSGLILRGRAKREQVVENMDKVKGIINDLKEKSKIPIRTVKLFSNDYTVCHKGVDILGIDYLGNIHPCLQFKMEKAINLENISLTQAIDYVSKNRMDYCDKS